MQEKNRALQHKVDDLEKRALASEGWVTSRFRESGGGEAGGGRGRLV